MMYMKNLESMTLTVIFSAILTLKGPINIYSQTVVFNVFICGFIYKCDVALQFHTHDFGALGTASVGQIDIESLVSNLQAPTCPPSCH